MYLFTHHALFSSQSSSTLETQYRPAHRPLATSLTRDKMKKPETDNEVIRFYYRYRKRATTLLAAQLVSI